MIRYSKVPFLLFAFTTLLTGCPIEFEVSDDLNSYPLDTATDIPKTNFSPQLIEPVAILTKQCSLFDQEELLTNDTLVDQTQAISESLVYSSSATLTMANGDQIREMSHRFTFDAFERKQADETFRNFVLSPANSFVIVGILSQAASGISATNINEALGWVDIPFPSLTEWRSGLAPALTFETTSWSQADFIFTEGYIETLLDTFDTPVALIDQPNMSSSISDWLPDSLSTTKTLLQGAMSTNDSATRVIYASKTDLKTDLLTSYPDMQIIEGLWQDDSEYQEKLPMLNLTGVFPTYNSEKFKSVTVPFNDNNLALTVIMPLGEYGIDDISLREEFVNIQEKSSFQAIEVMLPLFNVTARNGNAGYSQLIPNGTYRETSDPGIY